MDRFEQLAFSKDEADQLIIRWGVKALAVAQLIRYIEGNELISRIKKGLLCGYSSVTQTTPKD